MADTVHAGAFDDDEGFELSVQDLCDEFRTNVSETEQTIFAYGEGLSDVEDEARGSNLKHTEPKKAVSAGKGKARVRANGRKRKYAEPTGDDTVDASARMDKLMRNFEGQNHKMWSEAWENQVPVDIDVTSLLNKDGTRNSKKMPTIEPLGHWDGNKSRSAISSDGIVLVAAFPGYLKGKDETGKPGARDILYDILMSFGQTVGIALRKAADQNTRDKAESYMRTTMEGELSGVFQLVLLWKAQGHSGVDGGAGPAKDVLKNVTTYTEAVKLLRKLRIVGQRVDHMYRTIDPAQHKFLVDLREKLKEKHAAFEGLATLEPTIFHGRSIIYNRETRMHVDSRDPKANLTPVLTIGKYTEGTLHIPQLGLTIDYMPGTLVMLRGSLLKHGVTFGGGQRISIAHFLHASMLRDVGVGPPPLVASEAPALGAKKEKASRESDSTALPSSSRIAKRAKLQ